MIISKQFITIFIKLLIMIIMVHDTENESYSQFYWKLWKQAQLTSVNVTQNSENKLFK